VTPGASHETICPVVGYFFRDSLPAAFTRRRWLVALTLAASVSAFACGGMSDTATRQFEYLPAGTRAVAVPNIAVGGVTASFATGSGGASLAAGGSGATASNATGGVPGGGGSAGTSSIISAQQLLGAPLLYSPTSQGFSVSVVLAVGDPAELGLRIRKVGAVAFETVPTRVLPAADIAQWAVTGLEADSRYEYEVTSPVLGGDAVLYHGSAQTQRKSGQGFTFALLSDSHIGSDLSFSNQGIPNVLAAVAGSIRAADPDFMINLGDLLDFHEYGFGLPPPSSAVARQAHLNYRALLGDAAGNAAHYTVIGNWDGENGAFTDEEISRSRSQRLLYIPGPDDTTYSEGGSPFEDYYAFTWGDALFVVLNVMTYTPTDHLLSGNIGLPDDWTLGQQQLEWLSTTLSNAKAKWRFLFIHHTVGGAAGNIANSAYGRGGGQAANVGEQATVHQLMKTYGVQIFFYGHDHVFTDMVVDDIHYSLPGSAGAPWTFSTAETGYTDYFTDSGWARVDVEPESVHVQFNSISGQVLYEYMLP